MKDLIDKQGSSQGHTQSFERFTAMAPGEFWRFTGVKEIPHVEKGHLLLIERIDDVDNQPHTLHIRYHPSVIESLRSETFKMRVQVFIENFEFVDKNTAEASRQKNVEDIQNRIKQAQDELIEITTNVALLDDKIAQAEFDNGESSDEVQLPSVIEQVDADIVSAINTQKVSALMSPGLTAKGIEQIKAGMQFQRDITVKRADFIQNQTKTLSQIATEMTPYFKEQAATALAVTSDMRDHVDSLMKGIGTLNLYVLKNVEVEVIREGKSADPSLPLTIAQSILYMDEEAVVHFDVDEDFDCRNRHQFFDYLSISTELLDQIFPTQRSVVGMAATREERDYQSRGHSAMESMHLTMENQTMFLLVRDGERLSVVLSPEFWHQQTTRLFPSQDDVENKFKGIDGSQITYDDVDYTSSLKSHDALALKYKRLLVLLCGLDHNKRVFGDFYDGEPSLDFISLEFQEKYFKFIHDADGEGLIATSRPSSVDDWLKELNSEVTVGSRLLLIPYKVVDEDTLPSAFEKETNWHIINKTSPSMRYSMEKNKHGYYVGTVRTEKGRMVIDVTLSGFNAKYEDREFNSKFYVDEMLKSRSSDGFINLDRLDSVDVEWYIRDRRSRAVNIEKIKLIKCAALYNKKMFAFEAPVRNALINALKEGNVAAGDEARILVNKAVAKWKCAHPKKDINEILRSPKAFNGLCDQMFALAGKIKDVKPDIEAAERNSGRRLVRLSLLSDGSYCAYSECNPSDVDNELMPFIWVNRTRYTLNKGDLKGAKSTFALMKKVANEETVQFEADDVDKFVAPENPPFRTLKAKHKVFEKLGSPNDIIATINTAKADDEAFHALVKSYSRKRSAMSNNYVAEPQTCILFGVTLRVDTDGDSFISRIGMSCKSHRIMIWLAKDDPSKLSKFKSEFISVYRDKDVALKRFDSELSDVKNIQDVWGVMRFNKIEIAESYLFGDCADEYSIDRSMFAEYSHDQSLHEYISGSPRSKRNRHNGLWLHPDLSGSVDAYCGLDKPEDFDPHLLIKGSFRSNDEKVFLFRVGDLADGEMDLFRRESYGVTPYNTASEALKVENRERRYTYNSKSVMSTPREVEPQKYKGVMSKKSWQHFDEDLIELDE